MNTHRKKSIKVSKNDVKPLVFSHLVLELKHFERKKRIANTLPDIGGLKTQGTKDIEGTECTRPLFFSLKKRSHLVGRGVFFVV